MCVAALVYAVTPGTERGARGLLHCTVDGMFSPAWSSQEKELSTRLILLKVVFDWDDDMPDLWYDTLEYGIAAVVQVLTHLQRRTTEQAGTSGFSAWSRLSRL